jgi:peptide/nickel transport system permease protein
MAIVAVVLGCAVLAPHVAPYNPTAVSFATILRPPGHAHPFGTDQLGRDVLSRVVYGARIALAVGIASVVIAGWIGCTLGLFSGYFGGWLDAAIMRIADVQLSFPFILLALTLNAIVGSGLRNIIASLVIAGWPLYVRVVRGEVLALRYREYVQAAVATGAPIARILVRHILPNVTATIIILTTIGLGAAILAESGLSFLGFGVPPPYPAWGAMLSGSGRTYMFRAPWMAIWPGIAISLAVFGFNMLGDALRDVLDPRLRGR